MTHTVHFVTFSQTAITQRWLRDGSRWRRVSGFTQPLSTPQTGKVYIFADRTWPFYVGKASQSIGTRLGGAFRATPERRVNGFAGYRFKNHMSEAFLHVFMGSDEAPWSGEDAECIEAEVVYRIRQAGSWPKYQTEIHFACPQDKHAEAADKIIGVFRALKAKSTLRRPPDAP